MKLSNIDVNFDFTSDTPRYWDGYWERMDGMGRAELDPDTRSPMMRKYHQLLWSKPLPNGEVMDLEDGRSKFYLKWKDFYFGSDSILASFRYWKNRQLIKDVEQNVGGVPIFHNARTGTRMRRRCLLYRDDFRIITAWLCECVDC